MKLAEHLDVIDENDQVIQVLPKSEIYKHLHPHRIVHILIFSDKGEMLLQKRSKTVRYKPLHWSTSVGGHVGTGQSYEEAALREYQEELGTTSPLEFFSKEWYENADPEHTHQTGHRKILYIYKTINNGPFTIDKKELEDAKFFGLEEIQKMINNGEKFHPELLFILRKYYRIN